MDNTQFGFPGQREASIRPPTMGEKRNHKASLRYRNALQTETSVTGEIFTNWEDLWFSRKQRQLGPIFKWTDYKSDPPPV
mgnify:FL=1